MFYTVFSTNDTPYMQWQSDLLEYSWKRVGQEGTLIRLVATDNPAKLPSQKYAHCIATCSWDRHPETGDLYPVYNKPASLLEWLFRERPEGTLLLLDPDCVFRKPVTRRVSPGYPASQAWIDFSTSKPGAGNPFGLGSRFAFLKDFCVRTDLSIDAVMIPTLIHTSDLRKICARWLELCSTIRQNYRNDNGQPIWESEMYAYLGASAEYGLQNEPISLGVCTNWLPEDAPDTPIIHYCQTIVSKSGDEIFTKHRYSPWTRIESSDEPKHEYGRDLISLINDYVDDVEGAMRPPALYRRPKWRDNVMEGRVLDEILLEYPAENRTLWLNVSGKAIWELCDGSRTIDEIGAELAQRFAVQARDVTADVAITIGQLRAAGLLQVR